MGFGHPRFRTREDGPLFLQRSSDQGVSLTAEPPAWLFIQGDPAGSSFTELSVSLADPGLYNARIARSWLMFDGNIVRLDRDQPAAGADLPALDPEFQARVYRARMAELQLERPIPLPQPGEQPKVWKPADAQRIAEGTTRFPFTVPLDCYVLSLDPERLCGEERSLIVTTGTPGWSEHTILRAWHILHTGSLTELRRPKFPGFPPGSTYHGPWFPAAVLSEARLWQSGDRRHFGKAPPETTGWSMLSTLTSDDRPRKVVLERDGTVRVTMLINEQ